MFRLPGIWALLGLDEQERGPFGVSPRPPSVRSARTAAGSLRAISSALLHLLLHSQYFLLII